MTQQSRQQTLEDIRTEHKTLLVQVERPGEVDLERVRGFLKTLAQAGTITEDAEDRSLLYELIRYWSSLINEKTGEFPAVQLQPFDASLIHSRPTRRLALFRPRATKSPASSSPRSSEAPNQTNPSVIRDESNRRAMLKRVHSIWIGGLLEHSLHDEAFITLGLHERPDLIENPWRLILQELDQPTHLLPANTSITQVYDNANGSLLILGAPGSGKTTLLLQLARDLLDLASLDEAHPMPIVFNLSSWAMKHQTLTEWLVDELGSKYQVPQKIGQSWVDTGQVLPLLDSLDEVAREHRAVCVKAINAYRLEQVLVPLVVCGRTTEYLALETKILVQKAVVIQPLTMQQIDDYLRSAGQALEVVRVALYNDPMLQEIATTPLMLNILMLVYRGESVEELLRETPLHERQRKLFAHYVERMLKRRSPLTPWTQEQCLQWLCYLAQQLRAHSQTIFYLEHLQSDWLTPALRQTYHWLGICLPAIVIGVLASPMLLLFFNSSANLTSLLPVGLLGGLLGGLFCQTPYVQRESSALPLSPVPATFPRLLLHVLLSLGIGLVYALLSPSRVPDATLSDWLVAGSLVGGIMALGCFVLLTLLSPSAREPIHVPLGMGGPRLRPVLDSSRAGRLLLVALVLGLSSGLGKWLSLWLTSGMIWGLNDPFSFVWSFPVNDWLRTGLFLGLSNTLSNALLFGLTGALVERVVSTQAADLRLTERLRWTLKSLLTSLGRPRHLRSTLWLGCIFALPSGLSAGLGAGWDRGLGVQLPIGVSVGLSFGLSVALSYWFLLGLWSGIAQERLEDQQRQVPNQGIRRCWHNSLIMGTISGGLIGVTSLLSRGLITTLSIWLLGQSNEILLLVLTELSNNMSNELLVAVIGGCFVWLLSGGWTILRHYLLRRLLARSHIFPWRAQFFLDDMTTRLLLRKVGGGYIFVHRLLLEYFASLDTTSTSEATAVEASPQQGNAAKLQQISPGDNVGS